MGRRNRQRTRFTRGEKASIFFELLDLITGIGRVLVRLPMLILRIFD